MVMTKDELIAKIKLAWAKAKYPGDTVLSEKEGSCPSEYQYISSYFKGKKWADISFEALVNDYPGPEDACLTFMSKEALQYFLPAFMLIAIDYNNSGYTVSDSAVNELLPPQDPNELVQKVLKHDPKIKEMVNSMKWDQDKMLIRWRMRTQGFSSDQKAVIVKFLHFALKGSEVDFVIAKIQSGISLWENRED